MDKDADTSFKRLDTDQPWGLAAVSTAAFLLRALEHILAITLLVIVLLAAALYTSSGYELARGPDG
jgi:hypothetical protein